MLKWIEFIVVLLVVISQLLYGQEDEIMPKANIIRFVTPNKKIESYIEIKDSVLAVIDILKDKWGEIEDQNGIIQWHNVMIDSLEGKTNVTLMHGIIKEGREGFKTCPISKKENKNKVRVLRLRFMQKDRDILSSPVTSGIVLNFINDIISQAFEATDEDIDEYEN